MRIAAGVIVGYIAMFACVFALLTGSWLALGPSGAFISNTYSVSATWIGLSIISGLLAAFIGGKVALALGGVKAAWWLSGVAFALGLLMAFPTLVPNADLGTRSADIAMSEAMMKAQTPPWVAFLNPFLAMAGIWLAVKTQKAPAG